MPCVSLLPFFSASKNAFAVSAGMEFIVTFKKKQLMKNKLPYFLLCCIAAFSSFVSCTGSKTGTDTVAGGQEEKVKTDTGNRVVTDWETDGLKGRVKKMHMYGPPHEEFSDEWVPINSKEYDTSGFVTGIWSYGTSGRMTYATLYEYDSEHKLVKEERHVFFQLVNLLSEAIYAYDREGKLTKQIYRCFAECNDSGQEEVTLTSYKYDRKGQLIEEVSLDSSQGKQVCKFTHQYDENGNMTETTAYGEEDKPTGRTTDKYDDKLRKVEECIYNQNGRLSTKTTYEYNADGRLALELKYNSGGELCGKYAHKYNSSGNEVETTIEQLGPFKFTTKIRYEYDKQGNKTKEMEVKEDGKTEETFRYEYDYYDYMTE